MVDLHGAVRVISDHAGWFGVMLVHEGPKLGPQAMIRMVWARRVLEELRHVSIDQDDIGVHTGKRRVQCNWGIGEPRI